MWARFMSDETLEFGLQDGVADKSETYRISGDFSSLLFLGQHQRVGRPVDSLQQFLDLLPRCFASWYELNNWLLDQGLPVQPER